MGGRPKDSAKIAMAAAAADMALKTVPVQLMVEELTNFMEGQSPGQGFGGDIDLSQAGQHVHQDTGAGGDSSVFFLVMSSLCGQSQHDQIKAYCELLLQ